MDWTTPLKAQQIDFIQRLKSGSLLNCETKGQHSELTVISGEQLRKLKDFCWEMAEKYKRTSTVRDIFINNLKGKLGEEVVKARLANMVTEVDYEKRLIGDGKVDFIMTSDSSIGIQVKTRHSSVDKAKWLIKSEEVQKNAVLVCILIQEEVNESQDKYNLVFAGFLPTNMINMSENETWIGINELLYSSGLKTYLQYLEFDNCPLVDNDIQKSSKNRDSSDLSMTISCGSWSYKLPLEEILSLETEIQKMTKQKPGVKEEVANVNIHPIRAIRELELHQIWFKVAKNIDAVPARQALLQLAILKSFDSKQALIIVRAAWLKHVKENYLNLIEDAFIKTFNYKVEILLEADK